MKRTETVNIGGMVFTLDEDACERLKSYLSAIESHFAGASEKQEIMVDVEARIAELFKQKLTAYRQVISIGDVEEIIRIMGKPSDFGGNATESKAEEGFRYRRIYRDPDSRVLGGVCSGIGAYWNIDPVFVRLLFLLAILAFGVSVLIYLLLWIVIPPARTTAQKLEMRGEAVTFDNIGRFVKDEFGQVKRKWQRK